MMAKAPTSASAKEAAYYLANVPLAGVLPMNVGLTSANESTMVSLLGSPQLPLTTVDQPARASARVKALDVTKTLSSHVKVTGIKPAVESLGRAVKAAIDAELKAGHDLDSVLGTEGMQNVRYRKPTSGAVSTKISNHAWGTAIDFKIVGHDAPGNTHDVVPRFIAVLIPFLNEEGWFSGVGFSARDTMHFEVADTTMHAWAKNNKL
jgi:hypothetical protein